MANPIPRIYRERVFAGADDGEPVGRIAATLPVSVSYVSKVQSRRKRTGEQTARPQRCHLVPKLSGLHAAILEQVNKHPDATITELRAWLLQTHKVSASTGLINKTLAALDLTPKKVHPRCRASTGGRGQGPHRMARAAARADPIEACLHR